MMSLSKFKNFIDELAIEGGRNYKISVLEKYKDDADIKYYLKFILSPYIITGISDKKLNRFVSEEVPSNLLTKSLSVKDILDYIEINNTGRDKDIAVVNYFKDTYLIDPELLDLFNKIVTKNLPLGIDAKTVNKVIPYWIPVFNVQLAEKYFDCPEFVEGKSFTITTKIDGGRIVAIKQNGKVSFYTRAGQEYIGLVDLQQELAACKADNFMLDGELTLLNPGNLNSGEQYKQTMKLSRTKDTEKHGLKMLVFDYLPVQDFKNQECKLDYTERQALLADLFNSNQFNFFTKLPHLYSGTDTSKISEILNEQVAAGEEGIMINLNSARYEFKRTKNLLKCKLFNTADLKIVGFEKGINKYDNTLGALLLEYKDNIVKCGSGFADSQRDEIWNNQNKYINTIVEVSYFEETTNANGGTSIRFPIFKDFRPDKTEPNY